MDRDPMGETMTDATKGRGPGLLGRLEQGSVICAEGYLFELERRGYLQAGGFVPEVVLDHPEKVAQLHREFVHAGSDVVEAFTYYAHREKLRLIGKEDLLEQINRQALRLAIEVADETGTLVAGNVCNTNVWTGDESRDAVRAMFAEQVGWAVEAGVDFVVAETISWLGEALTALEVIKEAGLPAVVTLAAHHNPAMREGVSVAEACKRLEAAGADVVGLNCTRGPRTMLPLLREVRQAVSVSVAALPVPYRTTEEQPSFQSLRDDDPHTHLPEGRPFPTGLDPFTCNRYEIADFAREASELGVRYLGVCCGAAPHHIRAMAEALGRHPDASRYSEDMSKHAYFGTDPSLKDANREYASAGDL
ncbi:MAG: homocysteine S-methyltransferase family protein [Actinomycetota bacterium]|nr:homocysteine S-methyltransferase family protein [Actinomycetota bacterium]